MSQQFQMGNKIMGVNINENIFWGKIVGLENRTNQENPQEQTNLYRVQIVEAYGKKDYYAENKVDNMPNTHALINPNTTELEYYTEIAFEELKKAAKKSLQDQLQIRDEQKMADLEKRSRSPVVFPMDLGGGGRKKKRRKRTRRKGIKTRNKKKNQRKTKKLNNGKDDRCAPKPQGDRLPFSCYTKESLHKIKNIWNQRNPDKQIFSNDPKDIWRGLKKN